MKKVLVIVSAIVVVFAVVACRGGKKNTSGKSEPVEVTSQSIDEVVEYLLPDAVDIFVDASGSMKGYIEGVQGNLKNVVPSLIPNLKNSDRMGLCGDSIKCYTIVNTTLKKQDAEMFGQNITNASIFNGQSTELHEMLKVVANSIVANPNHVGVIISDCVLSFPANQLSSNREKNYNDIAVLSTEVTNAMTILYNKGMNVSVVKYTSDFNGNFYYDYHNQRLNIAKNQILKNRPFYFVLVGKRELVDAMFNKKVIPQGYEDVFCFNKEGTKPNGKFFRASKASSWIPNLDNNVPTIATNVNPNKNINAPYAYMVIDQFEMPSYLESQRESIMNTPKYDGKFVDSVVRVRQNDIQNDLIAVNGKRPDLTGQYIYKVIFKDNAVLKNLTQFNDRIYFVSPSADASNSEIEKDDANSLGNLEELEGKTFMFNHFIDGLRNAYSGGGAPLAEINLTIKTQ